MFGVISFSNDLYCLLVQAQFGFRLRLQMHSAQRRLVAGAGMHQRGSHARGLFISARLARTDTVLQKWIVRAVAILMLAPVVGPLVAPVVSSGKDPIVFPVVDTVVAPLVWFPLWLQAWLQLWIHV